MEVVIVIDSILTVLVYKYIRLWMKNNLIEDGSDV